MLALVSSILAAPTPKCGWKPDWKADWKPKWKPDGKFDPAKPVHEISKINERAAPYPWDEADVIRRVDC